MLEVGSSRLFLAPYIAVRHGLEVHATDQDPIVMLQKSWIRRLGYAELLASERFVVAREDATCLSYPDESFCLLYTSPSPRDRTRSRMPSSA